ncbi:MAG: capsular biosynthesis protein [Gammaproteobacteria bacterium]|nr:capsular biosynthesis protein [Gammaproteobacteria bacterium]
MIDLHCHLLPGIDDGAPTMDHALALARLAVVDGISHAVMTPHIHLGRYDNDRLAIQEIFQQYKSALEVESIPLVIGMGAEVRIDSAILPMIAEERIPFLGELDGFQILLLEFPHNTILPGTDKLVDYLLARNIRPLIAHPERNKAIMRDLSQLDPLLDAGCLLQVTAGSVAGAFGGRVRQRAEQMLERGWVSLLATDAHDEWNRPPFLSDGRDAAEEIVGKAAAHELVFEMPARIASSLFDQPPSVV